MSWLSEYEELKKKRKKQESTGDSFMDEYNKLKEERVEEVYQAADAGIIPKVEYSKPAVAQARDDSGWFTDGSGNIAQNILGTAGDAVEKLGAGLLGLGEKLLDGLVVASQYAAEGQYYQNGGAYQPVAQQQAAKASFDAGKQWAYDFAAKDLYDENKIAETIVDGVAGVDVDNYSVFGDKMDSTIQSGGELAGTVALQAAGVPAWLTTGLSSFGGEVENAANNGATVDEAVASGLITAGAEVLSERFSGGIRLGGATLDDAASKELSRLISNKVLRTAVKLGMDATGEGAEEVFSGAISAVGQKLTYADEKEWEELFSNEDAWDSFVGGAIMGAVSGSTKAAKDTIKHKDYTSQMTNNESKVVEHVYKERVAEAEKNGKISQGEKRAIYDEVLEYMEKGYISTDTIEEVLLGDDYKPYKDSLNEETALKEELEALQDEYDELGKKEKPTLADQARFNELTMQLKDIQTKIDDPNTKAQRDLLKAQLNKHGYELTKSDKLRESYFERVRADQKFEVDLNQYKGRSRDVMQKVMESGLADNTNQTHEFWDMMANLSDSMDTDITLANNEQILEMVKAEHEADGLEFDANKFKGQIIDGYVSKNGIVLNAESKRALNFVVGHEITHKLEGTKHYAKLQELLFEYAKDEYESRFNERAGQYKNKFEADDKFKSKVDQEITGDLVGDYVFNDKGFIDHLTKDQNVFQKVWNEIKYMAKIAKAGSKEAKQLERVKREFERAWREAQKNTADGGVQYSLSDSDGKQLSKGQQEYFKDSKVRDENGNLKVMYHGSQDAGFHVFDASMSDDDTSFFFVDRNDVATTYSGTSETYAPKAFKTAEDANKFFAEIGKTEYEVVEKDGEYTLYDDGDEVATSNDLSEIYDEWRDWEGAGYGDANYKVYLNLTNPLEVDAKGRPWNKIDAEFSQEVYDKYQSLTTEEKAALTDLAEWEDFSLFNSEIQEARNNELASAYQKMGEDCNIYDLFSVASENFSEEAMRENARNYLKTRDYAQRAKEQGYDGVIFKNIVDNGGYSNGSEGASTVAIAFDSNQIKSVANESPTGDADIRYSLSDSAGNQLTREQSEFFKDSKIRDADGNLKVMHHGSGEDFTVFDRKKAKSSGYYGSGFYFTDSDSHAKQYGNTYDVYLNITNPLQDGTNDITKDQLRKFVEAIAENEDYGIDNYGYGATVDSVTDSVYGKSDFAMLMDINASCVGNMVEAIELFNEVNGTDYNGIIAPTETVAFYPNQIKSVTNQNPTGNPDIRFSLSEAVEETKDLIAIHNLRSSELPKALELGGMPMPSIAVIKAQQSHEAYGDVSLIFPKDTIDPKKNRANKIYGGDAWTPTYPSIEYKASTKAQKAIESKIDRLVPYDVQRNLGHLSLDYDNLSSDLNRHNGDLAKAYSNNYAMQYAFLVDNGYSEQLPMTEKQLDGSGRFDNSLIVEVAEKFGASEVERLANEDIWGNDAIISELRDIANESANAKYAGNSELLKVLRSKPLYTEKNFGFAQADSIIRAAHHYVRNGFEQTVDYKKATDVIKNAVDEDAYKKWLDDLFSDIVEKEGIRNNADYFTPSGNRRSWEALHWENTLENVLKVMKAQNQTGADSFFGTTNIFGVANKDYGSIAEVKADSDRLRTIPEEEYEAIKKGFSDRFAEIADSIKNPHESNRFIALDHAAEEIVDAVRSNKTESGMLRYMQKWNKRVSAQTVEDIVSLVNDISNMPTGYFEAKPQRAVVFDEVGVFVIPRNADVKLKQELLNRGYSIAEYDPDVEGDRQKVVNQFEEYKFSLSDVGQQHRNTGGYKYYSHIPNSDIAPVAETVSKAESVAPVAVAENETTTDDLFPDDLAPIQNEISTIADKLASVEDQLYAMTESGEFGEAFNQLSEEWGALKARIDELEQYDRDRAASLDDADAPPEMDAPYYGEPDKPTMPDDPFYERDIQEVGNKQVKAYMYENPEVKHFFQEAANVMLGDLHSGTKGEKIYNGDLYYSSGGEKGWMGTKRQTTDDIAELLDQWHYTYDQIEKGLNAIIEDHGAENNAVSKRIEFMLNDRLMYGYTGVWGEPIPANQDYINLLNEKQITEYSKEAFDSFMATADQYAPIAPVVEESMASPVTNEAPVAEQYEAIRPKPTKEPRMARATPEEQARNSNVAKILFDHKQTPKQKSAWKWAREHVFSHGAVFEDMSLKTGNRELQAKFDNIRRAESAAQYFMGKGKGNAKALVDVRKAVEQSGKIEDFNYYLYHLHNVDRMTLEQRFKDVPNKSVFGESVDAEVSRKAALNLETLNPEFKQWADEVYAINKHLRQMMVDEGIISQETADLWQEMYPHYVPISRADAKGLNVSVPLDTKRTGVNAPIKKATGGNSDFYNVFDTMGSRIEQTYKAIAKNRFGVELMGTLGTAYESDVADIDTVLETMDQHEELLQEGKNGENPSFTVFQNGERVKFAITEDMYDAMKPSQFTYTSEALKKINDIRRDVLTTYSPTFALTNPIKDVQDILLNSQHPARTYAAVPEAIYAVLSKNHWYQERMASGGNQDSYFDGQTKTFKKEDGLFKKVVGYVPSKIQAANEIIEQVPRMAEYIASRKMGRSIDVSMLDAARVTTNFGAAGDLTNMLNRNGFTFLGASVEGFNQQVRNIREAKAEGLKGWAKLAGKYLVAGLPALLLNHALWDDDEEYEELSDYVKQNYYVIAKTKDGKFVRIPKGRAVAVIQDAFKQMENLITGNDDVDLESFGQLVLNNLAPNNPLENNLIAPVVQAATNKTWYGDDLVPTRLQDVPEAEQFDETTDSISKWLGETTNTSPYKWNYLLDQYTGGVGDMVLPYLTPEADGGGLGAAFRDKFVTDPVLKNQNVTDFYNTVDELTVNANSSKATDEDVLKSKYMSSVSSEIGKLYQQKREIQNSDLSDAEKYEEVRAIQRQIDDLAKNSLDSYGNVEIDGKYATVGDVQFRWYEPGEDSNAEAGWKKLTEDQIEKQDEVTKGLGISPSEYWSDKGKYDFAYEYPDKYEFLSDNGVTYDDYKNGSEEFKEAWTWASKNPGKFTLSKAVAGDVVTYRKYTGELYDIKADKDSNGKSISGSRKEKVIDYINNMDLDYGQKIILFKSEYEADDSYNYDIVDYLNSRDDISYDEMKTILEELGFKVDSNGNITWD